MLSTLLESSDPVVKKGVIENCELTLWNVSLWATLSVLKPLLPGTDKPLRVSHTLPATQKMRLIHKHTIEPVFRA